MNDKASTDTTASPAEAAVEAASEEFFGSDELGQLQRILFGDHARKTNDRIDTLERALLGALADLSDQVGADMAAVAKRVDADAANRTQATANLAARLEEDIERGVQSTSRLKGDLDKSFERLTEALDSVSADLRVEIDAVRSDMTASIETARAELDERKLDRGALAALLSATANEL